MLTNSRPCPLCKNKRAKTFIKGCKDNSISPCDFSYGYSLRKCPKVVKCVSCGLLYVPEITENIADLYEKVEDVEYEKTAHFRTETFRSFLDVKERYAPQKGSLLDVGCYTGLFMEIAKDAGYTVEGIELSRWACRKAKEKNLSVFSRSIEELEKHKLYDCITMWDVIEHVPDPVSFLSFAWKHLNKGGCLLMTTPDVGNPLMRVLGGYHWLFAPWHLTYFDRQTITKLIESLNNPRCIIDIAPPYKSNISLSLKKLTRIPVLGVCAEMASRVLALCDFPVKLRAALLVIIFK